MVDQPAPQFSVIVPTFRRNAELRETITSVLEQRDVTFEIIVVDDSPEAAARDTVAAFADPRIRYLSREVPSKGHPSKVRNDGLRLARGEFVHFLDDDDHVMPGALAAVAREMARHPSAGVAIGRVHCFGPDGPEVAYQQERYAWAARWGLRFRASRFLTVGVTLFRAPLLLNSACVIRRTCAQALGGYDTDMSYVEDVDFFVRAIRRYGHVVVPVDVLHYRVGTPSMLRNLHGNLSPIVEGWRHLHVRYRREFGPVEYRLLQVVSKALPIAVPAVH